MPQMKPILWLNLFIIFSLLIFIYNVMNYYIFFYKINNFKNNKILLNKLNWKW